jgi:RHS repeat-associated protein
MRRIEDTPAITTLDATVNNQRYLPYVSQVATRVWEVGGPANGSIITLQTTNISVDSYGNAYDVTTSTVDRDVSSPWYLQTWSTHVVKTITNDTTNWCLGIPTQTTVQNTLPGGSNLTRTTSSTVDYVNCRVTQDAVEPSSTTLNVTTTYGFDTCGNVNSTAVVGKNPDTSTMATRTTSANFGSRCQFPESVTNAQNETTQTAYRYDLGVPSSVTDPNGIATTWQYDNYGRRTHEFHADGTATTWGIAPCDSTNGYCGVSDLRSVVTQTEYAVGGGQIRYAYLYSDGFDRLRYNEQLNLAGGLSRQVTLYDALGRHLVQYVPISTGGWHFHQYSYDLANRRTADALYLAGGVFDRQTTLAYAGRAVTITDPKGNLTTKHVNVLGQLGRVTDPSPGGQTNYAYEPFGNLSSVTDAASNVTSWSYNLNGALTGTSDVDRGSWSYSPNSLGELVAQTDAKSQNTTFVYDKVGRLTSRAEAEGTSHWAWGASAAAKNIGKLASMDGPGGYSELYYYDTLGRPAATVYNADQAYQIDYAYSATTGFPDNVTYPYSTGGYRLRAQYLYQNGILNQVRDYNAPSTVWWQLNAEDARGMPIEEQLANTVHILSNYDELTGHLNWRTSGKNGTYDDQQDITFQYDKNENLTDRIDVLQSNLTEHFVYDALDRLDYSTLNGGTNLDVTLDVIGNIGYRSDVGNYTYHSTRKHAVASTSNGWSFTYDNNGNMQTGRGATITWTSYNMPASISNGGVSSTFSYTPNRKYWKQLSQYSGGPENTIYVGGLLEKVVTNTSTDYHHMIRAGSALIVVSRTTGSTDNTYYVTQDSLGSSSVTTNNAGTVTVKQSFAAYGGRRGSNWTGTPTAGDSTAIATSTRRGYTAHTELDNLGLVHMNGRVYDPAIGRFLSADPFVPHVSSSQSFNRYSYVQNRPTTRIDPTGYVDDKTLPVDTVTVSGHRDAPSVGAGANSLQGSTGGKRGGSRQRDSAGDSDEEMPEVIVKGTRPTSPGVPAIPVQLQVPRPWQCTPGVNDKNFPTPTNESLNFDPNGPGQLKNAFQHPWRDALQIQNLYDEANGLTKVIYGLDTHNNEGDAFRHSYWSFTVTREFGAAEAKAFGDAHEISVRNKPEERLMDLYNNQVGRELAIHTDTSIRPIDAIRDAIAAGCLRVSLF